MRIAVTQAISQQDVQTDQPEKLRHCVNKELRASMREVRKSVNALNAEPIYPAVVSDGAGTFAVLWTSAEMPQDGVWIVQATVVGIGATQRAAYQLTRGFYSTAGTCASLTAAAILLQGETAVGCDARFVLDTVNRVVTVEARDDAAEAMNWTGTVQTFEAVPSDA